MNFFRKIKHAFETRNLASAIVLRKDSAPKPVYTSFTIKRAVASGYKDNSWVFRSINLKSRAAGSVEWYVVNEDGEKVDGHPLNELFMKPNPYISKQDLFELIVMWMELVGNSYLKKVTVGRQTKEIWPISPDRLRPVPTTDPEKWISGYALDKSRTVTYESDEIIHHKYMNPANPVIGIGPLEILSKTVDVDNDQRDFNKSTSQNRGVVDGVFAFKRRFDEQADADAVRDSLNETYKKKRTFGVIGDEANYFRTALTPAEMDFIESRKSNREEIFIAFGVPPVYAGVTEAATLNNYQTSELIFWFGTMLFLLDNLKDTFNFTFADELGLGNKIVYDVSNIPAIRAALYDKTKTAKELYEMGVPFNQLNKVFKFGFEEFEGWDQSVPKSSSVAVTAGGETRAIKSNAPGPLEFRTSAEKNREEIEKEADSYKKTFLDLLQTDQEAVFDALDTNINADIDKILSGTRSVWADRLYKIYVGVGTDFGQNLVEKRSTPEEITAAIEEYLAQEDIILTEISEIHATTAAKIINQVRDALDAGSTMNQLQLAIIDTGIFNEKRALMLARTIAGNAANLGQWQSAKLSGADTKTWTTATFEVRDSHKKMDGVSAPIDGMFTVNGHKARFPQDNRLPPGERCNCFLPGTEVQGDVSKVMKSDYNGQAVKIVTGNGFVIRVSGNHPIMTQNGFVAANSIKQGDQLLTNKFNIKRPFDGGRNTDRMGESCKNNNPFLIENIFSTVSLFDLNEIRRTMPDDFYSDGQFIDGDVQIVRTHRELLGDIVTHHLNSSSKLCFKRVYSSLIDKTVDGSLLLGFQGIFAPTSFVPGTSHLPIDQPFIFFDFLPFDFFSVPSVSEFDSGVFKNPVNGLSGNTEYFSKFFDADSALILINYIETFGFNPLISTVRSCPGTFPTDDFGIVKNFIEGCRVNTVNLHNLGNRFPGNVSVDNVISIDGFHYNGPVYDVESPYGCIFANGILASNCRCTLTYGIEN